MMKIYRTQDKQLTRVDDMSEGAWICLTSPTDEEVRRVAATLDIEPTDIVAATDPEESARISLEDGYTVIIVDIPIKVDGASEGVYTTIPLGILLTQELIVTVCSVDTPVIGDFTACHIGQHRGTIRKCVRLGQEGQLYAILHNDLPLISLLGTCDNPKQGRLARAVDADDPDLFSLMNAAGDIIENPFISIKLAYVLDI